MTKVISYTLTCDGIFPKEPLCGGVQGEHRARAVEVTPDPELAERISQYKSDGKTVELSFEAVLSGGESVYTEKRSGEELFSPFYLAENMTASGRELTVIIKIYVYGEERLELVSGLVELYFTPCLGAEYEAFLEDDEEKAEKRAEEILSEIKATAEQLQKSVSTKADLAAASASTAARHLKKVEELKTEAEETRLSLEKGMEISIIGGGADADIVAIPDEEGRLKMKGVLGYREDTYQNWMDKNPVLLRGEPAVVRDGKDGNWLKIGDGVTPFKDLPYMKGPKGDGAEIEVDQAFNPKSENPQSGIAVAEALEGVGGRYEVIANITIPDDFTSYSYTVNAENYPDIAKITDFAVEMMVPKQSEVISGILTVSAKPVSGSRLTIARFENWNNANYNLKGFVFSKYFGGKRHNRYYGFGANSTQNMVNYSLLNAGGFGSFSELVFSLSDTSKVLPSGMQIKIEGFRAD